MTGWWKWGRFICCEVSGRDNHAQGRAQGAQSYELAPKELNGGETEEEIKETFETVSKADSQSTDVVSKDEIIAYQIVHEGNQKSNFKYYLLYCFLKKRR